MGVFALWLIFACHGTASPPGELPSSEHGSGARVTSPLAATFEAAAPHGPVDLDVQVWTTGGQADDVALPLVVALHGRGDTPERFQYFLLGYEGDLRVVAPRAPVPWLRGHSWFSTSSQQGAPELLAAELRARADDVARLIAALPSRYATIGRPVVTGFSQGGMMSYAVAITHPEAVAGAVPVAGFVPRPLAPDHASPAQAAVPIRAVHGTEDTVIPAVWDRHTSDALRAAGFDATLDLVDGVDHSAPPEVDAVVRRHVTSLLDVP